MTDDNQTKNRGSQQDEITGELAKVESSLQMDQIVPIKMSRPAKSALVRLAARRQSSLSNIVREATLRWVEQQYPEYRGFYVQALKEELERRKRKHG